MPGQQGFYYGGYPWKDFGVLTAKDLNAAIQLALSPISIIPPGSITNVMLANPWVQIGTTQINLGSAVNTLNGLHDPVNDLDVANKHYVDQRTGGSGSGGGISDAPADGTSYGRNNAAWVNVVPLAGGVTVTGTLGIGGALNANAGLNVTGGNLAVGTSGAQRNIGLFGMLLSSNNATPSLPNNSGSTASSGLRAQLADASGAMLGIGSNGVSGWWLNVTNITDLSQRYPLLLQPLGGDTRMGGNATVGGTLNVTGSTTVGPLIVNGNIAGQTLGLTTPLAVTSGGTGSGALALPPVMPGYGAWAGVLLVSNGSQVVTSNINQGYVATQGAGYVDLVSAGAGPAATLMFFGMRGTLAAPASVQTNDILGAEYFNGYDGAVVTNTNAAAVQYKVGSTWSPTNRETRILWWTTKPNFTGPANTMTLDGAGNLTVTGSFTAVGPYLWLGGGSGTVNGPGGPFLYADTANMVFHLGTTNANWLFQDTSGINKVQFRASDGALLMNAYLVLTASATYTNLYNPTGNSAIIAGGSGDATNYYRNSVHQIQSANGGATWLTIQSGNVQLGTGVGLNANAIGATTMQLNGGGNALTIPNGGISCAGGITVGGISNSGGYSQSGSGGNNFTGGVTAASLSVTGPLSVTGTSTFGGGVTANAGITVTQGGFNCNGTNAGYEFLDRSTGVQWVLYGSGGAARMFYSGIGDVWVVGNNGAVATTSMQLNGGGTQVLSVPGGGITVAGGSYFAGIWCTGLNSQGGSIAVGNINCNLVEADQTGAGTSFYSPNEGGSAVFYAANGGMTATAFNVSSDRRLKTDIADSDIGLQAVLALAPKTYRRTSMPDQEELGLIAQDVAEVLPMVVRTIEMEGQDDRLAIDYAGITTALINAVKELSARVAELEAR